MLSHYPIDSTFCGADTCAAQDKQRAYEPKEKQQGEPEVAASAAKADTTADKLIEA